MNGLNVEALDVFKKQTVVLDRLDEQFRIRTDNGWSLHIYNKAAISNFQGTEGSLLPVRLTMTGHLVSDTTLSLMFDDGTMLDVDMSPEGFEGPEAMQLTGPDGSIVIWD